MKRAGKGKGNKPRCFLLVAGALAAILSVSLYINLTFLRHNRKGKDPPSLPPPLPSTAKPQSLVGEKEIEPNTTPKPSQSPAEVCAAWNCDCQTAADMHAIQHSISFGTLSKEGQKWWIKNGCMHTTKDKPSTAEKVVLRRLADDRKGVQHATALELERMMAATPEGTSLDSCVDAAPHGQWQDRDVWVHLHSPWHLFYQSARLKDSLNITYVAEMCNKDFIEQDPKRRIIYPDTPNLKVLPTHGLDGAGIGTNHDGSETQFRVNQLQFDVKSLFTPQPYMLGNPMFCNAFRFSGNLLWERYRMDCIGEPLDMTFQCPQPTGLTQEHVTRVANLDEVRVWYPDSTSDTVAEVELVTAKNVILQKGDLLGCRERMIQREACAFNLRVEAYAKKEFKNDKNMLVVDKLLVIAQSFGYYHFVSEQLTRMSFFYDALLEDTSIKILVAHPSPYVTAFFEFLKIDPSRLLYHAGGKNGLIFAKQVWDTEATQCTCARRYPMLKLREILLRQIKDEIVPMARKHILFVKRIGEGGLRRNVTNYEDVKAKVQSMMSSDFPEESLVEWDGSTHATVAEYSKLFANAKIVFACMGAGMSNTVFMAPGTVVIEVAACGRLLYTHQSNALGLRHYGYCHSKQHGTKHWADPDEIATLIQGFLNYLPSE